MSEEQKAERKHPDPMTLRWMAERLVDEADELRKQDSHIITSGTDRVDLRARINTLMHVAQKCWNTADAVEESLGEQKWEKERADEGKEPLIVVPGGVE
jgi:hypothetical protein